MKTKLRNISNIQTGLFAKTESDGDVVYLQAKDFDENGVLRTTLHPDLKMKGNVEKHLLKVGDVLFAAKGTKNYAAVYESHNQPCVASTSFFVIRLKDNSILSEYLAWYLNNPNILQMLKSQAIGSSMVSISKSVLEDMEVSIPDLQTQRAVLRIIQLRNTEKKLMQQIEKLREKQIQYQVINAIK